MHSAMAEEDLADILWGGGRDRKEYHARGLVRSVSDDGVSVTVKGATLTLPKLAGCSASAGDVVLVLMTPSGGVVIDRFG